MTIKETKSVKNPITGKIHTKTVYSGEKASEKSEELKEKEQNVAKLYKEKNKAEHPGIFLPGPAGISPHRARRVEKGGKVVRLKRK